MAKTLAVNMPTHLGETVTTLATAWKIVRTDGTVFRFTSNSEPLLQVDFGIDSDGPQDYLSAVGFRRTNIANNAELDVDNLDSTGVFDDASITEMDLRAGLFDFAEVFVFFFNHQDTSASMGVIKMRRGWLGEVIVSPNGLFTTELRGLTQALTRRVGEFYSKDCRADLGDLRCRLPVRPDLLARNLAVNLGEFYRVVTDIPAGFTGSVTNIFNGGFESPTDLTGWVIEDGPWANNTSEPRTGARNLEVVGSTTDNIRQDVDLRVSMGGDIPDADLSAGKVNISVSVYGKNTQIADSHRLQVQALDSSSTLIGTVATTTRQGTSYGELVAAGNLPIGTAFMRIRLVSVEFGAGVTTRFDDLTASWENTAVLDGLGSGVYEDRIYEVTVAGTTAALQPTYDTVVGNTTVDGTATLTARESWIRFAVVSAVDAMEPRRKFTVTELTPNTGGPRGGFPDDWFNYGGCEFDTGDNAGRSMEVKDFVADDGITITQDIHLFLDMPFDIQVGDEIAIYPGCDKRMITCRDKFDNIINFVGEPYVPGQDFLAQYPDAR
jgi:uncharacterized phage protein (TIGR02218 family)